MIGTRDRILAVVLPVALGGAAFALAGCGATPRRDPALYRPAPGVVSEWEAALDRLGRGDREGAIARLRAVLAASPRFVKAHLLYQDAMIARGREAQVEAEYAGQADRSGLARALYARVVSAGKRIPLLEAAVAEEPDCAWIQYALGFERLRSLELSAAGVHLRRALALDPDLAGARVALAMLYARQFDWDAAGRELERYLVLCPLDAIRWYRLGRYRQTLGDADGAREAYRTAAAVSPEALTVAIRTRAVELAAEQRRRFEARCSTAYAARVNLSDLCLEQGQTVRAIGVLEPAVAENPRCPDAHYNLGIAYERLSQAAGTSGGGEAGAREAAAFAEKAGHHWDRYLALGGDQHERVRSWLEALRRRNPDPFGGATR